ncbi:hypothetical protein NBRC111894_1028 [Sporolactobacillus inulinus]|uniref:Uncharacterized protein n=1 Tax=Sporolactobacillus inulinus TaxID=2078 RepID=A0A4Y1Z906_9BACL|nr:hypothetical protein [Sporolactobacillus inulinus]GAY75474.1 hypothetical protein NBRC111894_1028 [Sporolactobacillus inulinus]
MKRQLKKFLIGRNTFSSKLHLYIDVKLDVEWQRAVAANHVHKGHDSQKNHFFSTLPDCR